MAKDAKAAHDALEKLYRIMAEFNAKFPVANALSDMVLIQAHTVMDQTDCSPIEILAGLLLASFAFMDTAPTEEKEAPANFIATKNAIKTLLDEILTYLDHKRELGKGH